MPKDWWLRLVLHLHIQSCKRWQMTEPQRHKLVLSGTVTVVLCLIVYLIVFGFHAMDPKGLVLMAAFLGMVWKISTIKKKHSPLI